VTTDKDACGPSASHSRKKHSLEKQTPRPVIPEPTHRRCTKCSQWLPFSAFPKHARMHNGISSHCRDCHREATNDWRERNRDELNERRRTAYRDEHPRAERACVVCGKPHSRRPGALVCGEECRNSRKAEQRKAAA
jgi:hypothetical protein